MVAPRTDPIDLCLDAVQAAIDRDPALAAQLAASRSEFVPTRPGPEDPLARRRLLEWFLLEKERPGTEEARIAALIESCARASGPSAGEVVRALSGSHASVFEVTGVDPGGSLRLWDMAGLFECVADEPEGSGLLAPGDLIVGRIFLVRPDRYRISRAADLWRNPLLLAAVRADLENARAARSPSQKGVLRLRQSQLEAMFRTAPPERAVDDARALLERSGVEASDAEAIFARLAEEPPGIGGLLRGGGDALGEILDQLAFATDVDLEAARRVLLAAWEEMHAPRRTSGPEAGSAEPRSVASAVAAFDRKREEGAPLEDVFRDLERDLDLADVPGDEEEDSPAPDFPGVVGAMIEEFLWDEAREKGAGEAERLAVLRSLGPFAADIGVFENLSGRELTAYACHWILDRREIADAGTAGSLIEALERFCAWVQENHEVRLQDEFAPLLAALAESLPRLVEANRRSLPPSDERGEDWLDFLGTNGNGLGRFTGAGGEAVELEAEPRVLELLRPGDVVRGRRSEAGRLAISGCFPPQIRSLENV